MPVKTYSLKADGSKKLSANFTVSEFANNQTDKVLVCDETIAALELVHTHFGKPINISSGFRLPESGTSQHNKGRAADFRISGVNPRDIAQWCEGNLWDKGLIGGLGLYDYKPTDKDSFVHIDTRTSNRAQWIQLVSTAAKETVVKSITRDYLCYSGGTVLQRTLKSGSRGDDVKELQSDLASLGYSPGTADGVFGAKTESAVKAMQKTAGIAQDGVFGPQSRAALLELLRMNAV